MSYRYNPLAKLGLDRVGRDAPLVRGQVSKMDSGTITIETQSVYVTTGLTGTFDTTTATGNNKVLGVKLAKNGTPIDQTECRAFTGSSAEEAKLVTNFMISMAANDEVALFIANHSGDVNITLGRARLVAVEVFA